MNRTKTDINWKAYALCITASIIIITVAAAFSKNWVLTAAPLGFLFGFFLQKGSLCGTSAISEILMFRDGRKAFGIWICIIVSMLGFALMETAGLINPAPKPFLWLNAVVGGVIFGIGIVLAGGCVVGTLFKSGEGHLNSIVALITIPFGVYAASTGFIGQFKTGLQKYNVNGRNGEALSLDNIFGVPFWLLAIVISLVTLIFILYKQFKISGRLIPSNPERKPFSHWLTHSWKPWQSGMAIGLIAAAVYLSSDAIGRNYPLRATDGVFYILLLFKNPVPLFNTPYWWAIIFVVSLVAGSLVSAKMSDKTGFLRKPTGQIIIAAVGGFLVGMGASIGKGCFYGHVVSGWSLMSAGSLLFGITIIISNLVTTYFYLMGRQLPGRQLVQKKERKVI